MMFTARDTPPRTTHLRVSSDATVVIFNGRYAYVHKRVKSNNKFEDAALLMTIRLLSQKWLQAN